MKYSICYTSQTGNTALLAETVRGALAAQQCLYFGAPTPAAAQADVLFIGFWTDKGTCDETLAAFLESLSEKRVFLFGTAGFGGDAAYFNDILKRVSVHLPQDNTLLGTYMCQGKMPPFVRARYAAMEVENPEQARPMLENFDRALSHPDAADLRNLEQRLHEIDADIVIEVMTCN